ncbi:MAG: LytR family transcriptional regulator [Pseudonocardiales bacterium]|nr:MAG: LytR family transcriptional regulator [Pseudonocardiales bacterium]
MSFFDDGLADDGRADEWALTQRIPRIDPATEQLTERIPIVAAPTEAAPPGRHQRRTDADERARRHAAAAPSRPAKESRRSRRRGKSMAWRVSTAAASFTLLLVLAAGAAAAYEYRKLNSQITRQAVLVTNDPNIRNAARQQHAENFLVIGSDTRAGADAKYGNASGARSDTTMLVHLSPDRAKATIISIPRDAWVTIPTCNATDGSTVQEHAQMFNSAFSIGGPKCTIKTVQKLTGIVVTHFVEIDFSGFASMVNALGSVSVCSPESVNDPFSGLQLHPGQNPLDGEQALAYVRARETLGDGSDLGRIKRQQLFLGAVLRQATKGSMLSNPGKLTRFLNAATKAITVDTATSFSDLRTLATSLQGLDPGRVLFYTAPIANQNYTPPGTSMTGRVLLDDIQGRALYDSVINDKKPVWVKKVHGKTRVVPSKPAVTAAATPPPVPTTGTPKSPKSTPPSSSINGAQNVCTL